MSPHESPRPTLRAEPVMSADPTERYVAIDNVCAWPNLTLLADGSIAVTVYNQPVHGRWYGDVECWASTDGGRLWTRLSVPARGEPPGNRMNVAAGRTAAGTFLVLASGWTPVLEPGDEGLGKPPEHGVLRALVCRSEDHGHVWTHEGTFVLPDESAPAPLPFGDVVEGDGGLLAASAYHRYQSGRNTAYFYVSTDNGASWRPRARIAALPFTRRRARLERRRPAHAAAAASRAPAAAGRRTDPPRLWETQSGTVRHQLTAQRG